MRLLLRSLLVVCISSSAASFGGQNEPPDRFASELIIPGQSVWQLKLGDARERARNLFPFKSNMDQEWREGADCGTTVNWLDMNNSKMKGNVFIRLKEDKVFQIDSGTSSFRTENGITIYSSPQDVRKKYPGLRAYVLSNGFSEASGARPLVYWVDSEKGIAFGFSYSRRDHKRYLNWIIIFRPHAEVCPQYEPLGPSDKRELPPYSLETDAQ